MFKNKKNIIIIFLIFIFFIISLISIYSASKDYLYKQIIWYLIGFLIIFLFHKFNISKIIIKHIFIIYVIFNFILLLLLFLGPSINGSKCWFIIPKLGSFQPSEFMKIILIIVNSKIFYENKNANQGIIFLKIIILTLIPSVLTFMQPDTGMVLIYFLISTIMLFVYGIKKKIYLPIISLLLLITIIFFYIYNYNETLFLKIFGNSFYYRINRLLDWSNKDGMQITNALSSIKAAGLYGFGIGNNKIYIPEAHTDFIFSVFSSNTGFIGTIFLIISIILFDLVLVTKLLDKNNFNYIYSYIIIGFLIMIIFQQIQNISMNIGLLPIMGITLPFISYGGSSLLSYMLTISIITSN